MPPVDLIRRGVSHKHTVARAPGFFPVLEIERASSHQMAAGFVMGELEGSRACVLSFSVPLTCSLAPLVLDRERNQNPLPTVCLKLLDFDYEKETKKWKRKVRDW